MTRIIMFKSVEKFRSQLIELISFKLKLLIRFIRNKTCKNKQININIMSKSYSGKINKTRYDNLGKPMKPTSFIVKNMGGNFPEKQFTIVKRSFRSSTKPLSLDSTILVNELTAETFYRFRTSKIFNIWTPPFCTDLSTWLTPATWRFC